MSFKHSYKTSKTDPNIYFIYIKYISKCIKRLIVCVVDNMMDDADSSELTSWYRDSTWHHEFVGRHVCCGDNCSSPVNMLLPREMRINVVFRDGQTT